MTEQLEQLELAADSRRQRCGARFSFDGRQLRCDQAARHREGWHTATPRRDARVRWNDDGSYEASYPTRHS